MRARAYRNGVVLSPTVPFGSGDNAGRRLPTSPAIEGDRISRSLTARARPSPRGFSRWRRSGRLSLARGAFGVSARAGLDDDSGSSSPPDVDPRARGDDGGSRGVHDARVVTVVSTSRTARRCAPDARDASSCPARRGVCVPLGTGRRGRRRPPTSNESTIRSIMLQGASMGLDSRERE